MQRFSIKQLSSMFRTNRETVEKRASHLGLKYEDGENGAKLYDIFEIAQLRPPPARSEGAMSLEEVRTREATARAEGLEMDNARKRRELANVDELMAAQNVLFDEIAAIVKKSKMNDAEKEDCLSVISSVPRKCWGEF